jgi:hypothetical protein
MAKVDLDTTKITLEKGTFVNALTVLNEVAGDATDGAFFTPERGTGHYLLYVVNTSGTTPYDVTVKGGSGHFGTPDVVAEIAANKSALISLHDVGHYLILSGDDKGKVQVNVENAALKLAVIELPL